MPRAKGGPKTRRRHKRQLKLASGFVGGRKLYRQARSTLEKGLTYAYRDRKQKKRDYRALWVARINALAREHGFQAHVGPMRSRSQGWVRLRSAQPFEAPRILFNYMSRPEDWVQMRACVRLTREIFAQPAFDRYRGREISPGGEVQSDAQIDAFIRARTESAFHPCGTCRMGATSDALAVVDPQTRVIGLEALRVVDSSIMPSITTGNLNAPTIMLAEKAADHIRGRAPLARIPAPYYVAAGWEQAQR